MGQPGVEYYYSPFVFPPNDRYYTLIAPASSSCPLCPNALTVTAVHWVLYWPAACQIPVEITIVGATEAPEGSGCYFPDNNTVLWGPFVRTLDGSSGELLIDHVFPLSADLSERICVTQKAFASVDVLTFGDCPTVPESGDLESPRLVSDNTTDPCVTYNIRPGRGGPIDLVSFGFLGNLSMWVDVRDDCCRPVPTLPRTWGKLKTLYR